MRILAIDIGGMTQDILLFDSNVALENCVKMIMPSPTTIVMRGIREATARNRSVLFTGVNMGGGPSKRALQEHIRAGLGAYATPEAACTFDDDLAEVEKWGVVIVSPKEAAKLKDVEPIELKDLNLAAITKALEVFGAEPRFDGIGVAVLDHGAAPPGVSDRTFRFQHLRRVVEQKNELGTFVYLSHDVPDILTRMKAVAQSLDLDVPLLLLDTGVAAALGALDDPEVNHYSNRLIVNLGNMHTLAFNLHHSFILGLFEHHTRLLDAEKLDALLTKLVAGTLTDEEVLSDGGHGCFIIESAREEPFLAATGPRRRLMRDSAFNPYLATPHGDAMLIGCFGLIRGFAQRMAEWREEIERALRD